MPVTWNRGWGSKIVSRAMDGLEECVRVEMLAQAQRDCPVDRGTMRASLGVERDDANKCVYLGGGGAAKAYIFRQEIDRSLNHTVGKAGFIRDSVEMHASKLPKYIKRRI
jgi:hypothetical protein